MSYNLFYFLIGLVLIATAILVILALTDFEFVP